MHRTHLNGHITRLVTAATLAALAILASVHATVTPIPSPLLTLAAELGFTPESLTVAGITTNGASTILARLEYAEELCESLAAAKTAASSANSDVVQLGAALAIAPSSANLLQLYAAACAAHEQSLAQVAAARQQLVNTALEGFPTAEVELLANWRGSSGVRVPAHFRVAERSESEWRMVEAALRAERRAQRTGGSLDSEISTLLAAVRAEQDVLTAEYLLNTQLPSMQQVFDTFEAP